MEDAERDQNNLNKYITIELVVKTNKKKILWILSDITIMPWTEQNRTELNGKDTKAHTLTRTIILVGCRECHSAGLKCVDLFHLRLLYPCVRWVETKAKTCLQIFISIFFLYSLIQLGFFSPHITASVFDFVFSV